MLHQVEEPKRTSCGHIKLLQSFCNGWNARLALACGSTTSDSNMHVNEACVGCDSERLHDLCSLVRLVEVLNKRFPIHCYTTSSSFYIYLSPGIFALAESPRLSAYVNLGLSNFLV